MKASETNFLKFLQGTKQFMIPIYQRKYSWTTKQCRQLWDDTIRAAEDDNVKGHFIGSIVYIERSLYQISAVPQLLVIDGQQRMTTLTLFLLALGKAIEESGKSYEITKKKIMSYYLTNSEEDDELYHKLILTKNDNNTHVSLILDKPLPDEYSNRIVDNFNFFKNMIKDSGVDLNNLYKGISKLIVVDISLDRDHDNPQLIFESLNSTGLDLSQADLIRNYILMGLEPKEQSELYTDYWYPMEKSFGNLNDSTIFDRFMRDFLIVKTGRIPNVNDVYSSFKDYVNQSSKTIQEVVKDIYRYSSHYVKVAFQKEKDKEINQVLKDINTLKVDVSYPFLMEVYDDYEQQLLSKKDFIALLRLVESYVFRRAICGVPTNSLNKTFATLSKEIKKENYLESISAVLLLKDSYKRFPRNDEFVRELAIKDVYNFRNRNYVLKKLENFNRKEIVDIESYTIEHIMPQNTNLSTEWRQDLGSSWEEIHNTYLHTLGNLTLTRYNSELSDRPFKEKRDMIGGFADSPLRLNRELSKLDKWNEQEINARAKKLSELALEVWGYPSLSDDIVSTYKNKNISKEAVVYTIEDHAEYLQGEMLNLFNELRKRICNLDSSVREEFKKLYIAYKTSTNFVDIVPQKSRLRLSLNMLFNEIHDPKGICKDVSNLGRWGNGDVEVAISSLNEIEDVMFLIKQSFDKHRDED
ncbi:hypothetical protein BHU72_14955 [Desulfuribacillus stibiiarsenatis]|uniref:DUF262 domain-containing protein n=1 Tax=Desulfuribacillus stibiiarsenatis TaxID=1390249 RepID=A0A1E5L7E9_9FIRM|nr:DUF262 and DUF1524 domain-containing protein [Desulfuribacillus stibiiarsenatis]OEH85978.1 hypothetical protein BHU72_14955 [Desulfuribacillus stibiiarsenatis]